MSIFSRLQTSIRHSFIRSIFMFTALAGAILLSPTVLAAQAGYTATRYPIVLVHGLLGFDSALGGVLAYWYQIVPDLQSGGAQVFVAEVSGLNTTEVRGEQLAAQVRRVLALTGAQKVNLVGHSHGGPTIRYVAGIMPESVASITTVAGLNTKGTPIADFALKTKGTVVGGALKLGMESLAKLIDFTSGKKNAPEVLWNAFTSLSSEGMTQFNQTHPDGLPNADCAQKNGPELVNGIRYFSWTGNDPTTNILDPLDLVFATTGWISSVLDPTDTGGNDGLVTVCASRLGTQLGVYKQNHIDINNMFYGLVSPFDVKPVVIYREHANRLKNLGL